MRRVRIFVASSEDVAPERELVERVVNRLNVEFGRFAHLDVIRWETREYLAHDTFQSQIPEPASCDVVIAIFWSRIGQPLPETFRRAPDGSTYESGTAFEVRSSLENRDRGAETPDIAVFRKTIPPMVKVDDPGEIERSRDQWTRLERFFATYFRGPGNTHVRAVNPFDKLEAFGARVEKFLREWADKHLLEARRSSWSIEKKGSPFRGLSAFEAKHAEIFFGRDRKVARAIELLQDASEQQAEAATRALPAGARRTRRPFLLIVGTSGSGKSSLARAGIAPRLTKPGIIGHVDAWRTAVMRLGAESTPQIALARALLVTADLGSDDPQTDDPGGFGRALPELDPVGTGPAALAHRILEAPEAVLAQIVQALEQIAQTAAQTSEGRRRRAQLLLVVDQLEEVFRGDVDEDARRNFLRFVALLAGSGLVWVIATLRDDLYGRFIGDRDAMALKDSGATYDLLPPGDEELDEILQRSSEAAAIIYEAHPVTGETLDQRMLRDARGQDVLPLLQFSLGRLFLAREQRDGATYLTHAAYDEMGGLDGAINESGEAAFASVEGASDLSLARLLRQFVTPVQLRRNDSESLGFTIRPIRSDVARAQPLDRALLEALIEARILRTSRDGDDSGVVQIVHERVLTSWKRALGIIQGEKDFYRIREEIEQRRRDWERTGQQADRLLNAGKPLSDAESIAVDFRDELSAEILTYIGLSGKHARRRQTILQGLTLTFAATTVLAAALGLLANDASKQASKNYEDARDFGDQMIEMTAGTLGEVNGIQTTRIDQILLRIGSYFDRIETSNRSSDLLPQAVRPALARLGFGAALDDLRLSRAAMLNAFAATYKRQGAPDRALEKALASERIYRSFGDPTTASPRIRWELSLALEMKGDVYRERGIAFAKEHPESARAEWRKAEHEFGEVHALRETLVRQAPEDVTYLVGKAQAMTRLSDLARSLQRDREADALLVEVLRMDGDWYQRGPDDPVRRRELGWAFNKIGESRALSRDFPSALEAYGHALCLRRAAVVHEPDKWRLKLDLSWTLSGIGGVLRDQRRMQEAALIMQQAVAIRRGVYKENGGDARVTNDLLLGFEKLATVLTDQRNPRAVADLAREADEILDAVRQRGGETVKLAPVADRLHELDARARRSLDEPTPPAADAGQANAEAVGSDEGIRAFLSAVDDPEQAKICHANVLNSLARMGS